MFLGMCSVGFLEGFECLEGLRGDRMVVCKRFSHRPSWVIMLFFSLDLR